MGLHRIECAELNRRFIPIAVAFAAALVLLTGSAHAQCEVGNLITNCGFETDTAGWFESDAEALVRTLADSHGGVACGEAGAIPVAGVGYQMILGTCVPAEAETRYDLSGYFKLATGANPNCGISALFIDAPACAGFFVGNSWIPYGPVDSLEWKGVQGEIDVPSGVESIVLFPSCQASDDFVVRLDDVVFKFKSILGFFSDGFESGDLSKWILVNED